MAFKKAERKNARLRLALAGPSGSGKTLTALLIAQKMGKKIACLDSERGSASLYANRVTFDVDELEEHSIHTYLEKIKDAADGGYDVLVIDSYSHSWMGRGGALEQIDQGGGWTKAGKVVSPRVQKLVDAILSYPGHVICTMRSKMEHEIEKDSAGKVSVKKLGMAPQIREGTEYEFSFFIDLDRDGNATVSKTRCEGKVFRVGEMFSRDELTAKRFDSLKSWLADGGESPSAMMAERIRFAQSKSDLQALVAEIAKLPEEDRLTLRAVYTNRLAEFPSAV